MHRLIPYLLALALAAAAHAATVDRVLRTFDFEERAAGNVEDVPMDWIKLEGPGLPHYVNGGLTTDTACSGQYSFGFQLDGGSLIYRYPAGKIIAHPKARYRLHVMAKTAGLQNARARLTAYFADAGGAAIRASVQHSKPLISTADEWSPLDLELAAPEGAASLVIELGLVQPSLLKADSSIETGALEQDIRGRAWFDDLTVAQVPYVRLTTAAPGNVFRRSQSAVIDVSLSDRLTDDLVSRIDIRNADGAAVYQHNGALDVQAAGELKTGRLVLPALPAGWYRANLVVESHGTEVGRQSVDFVQLADDAEPTDAGPDPRIGLVATAVPFDKWNDLPRVLPLLGAARVKLAIWNDTGDIEHAPDLQFNRLVDQLQQLSITPTACLIAPPPSVRPSAIHTATWPALLKGDADAWQTPLALMMSRYAGHLNRWQFGADERAVEFTADPKLRQAYDAVLKTMNGLFSPPDLAMPWPIYTDSPTPAPAALALIVPTDVLPEHLPLYVNDALNRGRTKISLTLTAPSADQYGRAAEVRDLAQRIGYAMASNATRIDLPLPFDPELAQPSDTLLVQRTLVSALSGTNYQGRMPLSEDVDALLFDRQGQGVMLAWTKSPQAQPTTVQVMLGREPRSVDLNGNISPVLIPRADDGTSRIVIGPTPTLFIGIDGLLARLRTSFAFDNPLLESSFKPHVRRLTFVNPYPTPIAGKLKITGPAGWTLTLQSPTFNVPAGEKYDGVVTMEFPFSSTAGAKPLELTVQLDNGRSFKVPLTMRLGLGDLGVESSAFRDGADVVVQQLVTNYGTKPADYTAFAAFPGAARQERMIRGLPPGQTVIKRYRFNGVDSSGPKTIRCGVRETEGVRALTDEVLLP